MPTSIGPVGIPQGPGTRSRFSEWVGLRVTHWWCSTAPLAGRRARSFSRVCVDLLEGHRDPHGGLGLVAYNDIPRRRLPAPRRDVASPPSPSRSRSPLVARRRGLGRLWGAWIGVGLLVGGVLANGVSQFIWSRGVPDFIHFYSLSPDVWDVADFAIWWGLSAASRRSPWPR